MAANKPIRWGIISVGRISQDFITAHAYCKNTGHIFHAVAARDLVKAQEFAEKYGVEKAYGSYEELVKDPEVDVVYIGSIGPNHLPLSKLALNHGKHVLCEKTLCVNSRETRELIEFARERKLFLMEAIWSRCFPIYKKLREELAAGTIGEVKQVIASLCIPLTPMGVLDRKGFRDNGRGSVMDVGVYCVQFATLVFGLEKPLQILSGGHLNDDLVDECTSTTLIYSGGRTATLLTHYGVELPGDAYVIGTKGTLKLPCPFWSPTKLETPNETIEIEVPESATKGKYNFPGSGGLIYEAHHVRDCILKGLTESPLMSLDESLLISEILASIRQQVGVKYAQD